MDATALIEATVFIQIHAACAVLALIIGTLSLFWEKGTPLHKALGRIWIGLMLCVSASSFFISEIRVLGPYSPIHLLSLLTLFGLWGGWRAIRAGDVRTHRSTMIAVYGGGLIGAGLFTLLPGRIMHQVIFTDGGAMAVLFAILVAGTLVALHYQRRQRHAVRSRAAD
ncbi:DUF2306 domain-containing protein [Pelagibacterium lacus]|uniref:DUF2306 domain-containing protein n=1 Tax=Pelagibacterium lacus TaxID=2282655 RepID=A0A369W483_9HYPH|nr:DUF2306 domain-containing protein [Pelagibacterium lacus]RDE09358.1 DUF2306 domain-containing protein [Pelagibacterium lacus]